MRTPDIERRLFHALRQTEAIGEVAMKLLSQLTEQSVQTLSIVADLLVRGS